MKRETVVNFKHNIPILCACQAFSFFKLRMKVSPWEGGGRVCGGYPDAEAVGGMSQIDRGGSATLCAIKYHPSVAHVAQSIHPSIHPPSILVAEVGQFVAQS